MPQRTGEGALAGFAGKILPLWRPLQRVVNDKPPILLARFAERGNPLFPWQAMAEATLEETVETGGDGEGAVEAAAPPSGKKKIIMFAGIGVAFLLVASAGLYFTGMLDRFIGHNKEAAADAPPPKPMVFFDLPDFLVNLNSSGNKKSNFLKLSVSLQLENQEDTARVAAMMPRVIDNFQIYLRELRIEDLRGSDGIYRLREELLVRVNAAVSPVKVNEVLFKEMLVQ